MKLLKLLILLLVSVLLIHMPVSGNEIDSLADALSYDSRDYGIITPVKDQGGTSLCWAYAAINAAEASILKSGIAPNETADTLSLSPRQLGYARHNRGEDPLRNTSGESTGKIWEAESGNSSYALSIFSQWCGPTDNSLSEKCNGWENAEFKLKSAISFDGSNLKNSADARREIKKAIIQYGAVTFSYNNMDECDYYNPSNETGGGSSPHACTIIGWDDTIPASSFMPGGATQDGGWLVKNSYDTQPYFYLSYDNNSGSNIFAFSFVDNEEYDYNYFYDSATEDFFAGAIIRYQRAGNIFTAQKGEGTKAEYVCGVNVGIEGKNTGLTVKVYSDLEDMSDPLSGDLKAQAEIFAENAGYYTIELPEPVLVEAGSGFSVVAEISGGDGSYIKITENSGNSFLGKGESLGAAETAPRIKAYTKLIDKKLSFSSTAAHLSTGENDDGIFVMRYSNGSNLQDVKVYHVDASETYTFNIPDAWEKAQGSKIKCFLWKSFSSMTPVLCDEKDWE